MARLATKSYPMPQPDFGPDDWRGCFDKQDAMLKRLQAASDALPEGQVKDGLIHFSVADGYAYYLITSDDPLTLQWVPISDNYQTSAAEIRGLRRADIVQMLGWRRGTKHLI